GMQGLPAIMPASPATVAVLAGTECAVALAIRHVVAAIARASEQPAPRSALRVEEARGARTHAAVPTPRQHLSSGLDSAKQHPESQRQNRNGRSPKSTSHCSHLMISIKGRLTTRRS